MLRVSGTTQSPVGGRAMLAACTALACISANAHTASGHNDRFAVAGYLPEWRYLQWTEEEHKWRWDALAEHVTHFIIFSIEVSPDGTGFAAMDRFPPPATLRLAREAADRHGSKLQICFGGNSRTNGFPKLVASMKRRAKFLKRLVALCDEHGLDGVDYNWEYPRNDADWRGLFRLFVETRAAFAASRDPQRVISMAYYPDTRQEAQLASAPDAVGALDFMHAMSYDQPRQHSTWEFGKRSVDQGVSLLPASARRKLTMGLPFYARDVNTGEWTTFENMVKIHAGGKIDPSVDQIGSRYFNGADLIRRKVAYAKKAGLGGVMIWEIGQDNFINSIAKLDPATALLPVISDEIGKGASDSERDDAEL